MRKLVLAVILMFVAGLAMAQDVIVLRDGATILSKVEEVSETEIKFRKWSNMDGPLYSMKTSAVMSINYQNGEMDKFSVKPEEKAPEPKNVKEGWMERKGQTLALDGRVLKDKEIKKLLGEQNYKTYLAAKKQIAAGNTFGGLLAVSLITGVMSFAAYSYGVTEPAIVAVSVTSASVAFVSIPLMCTFKGIGNGRISWLADTYNEVGNATSFQFSPSLMNDNQGNMGLGLTLSVSF